MCLFEEIGDDADGASDNKITVLKIGEITYLPMLALGLLEQSPLIRCKEAITVGDVEELANKATNLPLRTEGIVSDHNTLLLHTQILFD